MNRIFRGLSELEVSSEIMEYLALAEKLYVDYLKDYKKLGLNLGKRFLRAYQEEELKSTNELEEIPSLITSFYSMGSESKQIEKILRKVRKDGEISHDELNEIHQFVLKCSKGPGIGEYRTNQVAIGKVVNGNPVVAFMPPKPQELNSMMSTFLDFFNNDDNKVFPNLADLMENNPFIKGIIVHACLVSIHPYRDGNGRISRMLQSIKIWDKTEELYGIKLFLPPIHLSSSYGEIRFDYTKHLYELQSSEFDPDKWNAWILYNLRLLQTQITNTDDTVKLILKNGEVTKKIDKKIDISVE